MAQSGQQYINITEEMKRVVSGCGRDPKDITLVTVSKTRTREEILEVYNAGCRDFGENRVHELLAKRDGLPGDIRWHLVGHLQKNKAKFVARGVELIHSVDSFDLAHEIDRRAEVPANILLEFNVSAEETKSGFRTKEEMLECADKITRELKHIAIRGLMTIASPSDDPEHVRAEFKKMYNLRARLASVLGNDEEKLALSMGMSGDWRVAIEEGATIIRLGTAIFGSR